VGVLHHVKLVLLIIGALWLSILAVTISLVIIGSGDTCRTLYILISLVSRVFDFKNQVFQGRELCAINSGFCNFELALNKFELVIVLVFLALQQSLDVRLLPIRATLVEVLYEVGKDIGSDSTTACTSPNSGIASQAIIRMFLLATASLLLWFFLSSDGWKVLWDDYGQRISAGLSQLWIEEWWVWVSVKQLALLLQLVSLFIYVIWIDLLHRLQLNKLPSQIKDLDQLWTKHHDVDPWIVLFEDWGRDAQQIVDALAEAVYIAIECRDNVVELCIGRSNHANILDTVFYGRHLLNKNFSIKAISLFIESKYWPLDIEYSFTPVFVELF
jgi:hypothetical protein